MSTVAAPSLSGWWSRTDHRVGPSFSLRPPILEVHRHIRSPTDRSRSGAGSLDVVVQANRGQQAVRAAFVDGEAGLWWHVVAAPSHAVVLDDAAHVVVGDHTELEVDATARAEAPGEVRTQLSGTPVGVVGVHRLAQVAVGLERADGGLGVAGLHRVVVAADDVGGC